MAYKNATIDLSGYTALVTGGRIKIGYHTALRLLRSGAKVIVTSRFPHSMVTTYKNEADFSEWKDRLYFYGLDLLRIDMIEEFINEIYNSFGSLDILINNAAQTIKDNTAEEEQAAIEASISNKVKNCEDLVQWQLPGPVRLNQLAVLGKTAIDGNVENAWVKLSTDVSLKDLLETQIVNVVAPYLLSTSFKPLLEESRNKNKFLINVSSLEGKFDVKSKSPAHPHTNMAKAALNMMTKTFANEYKRSSIFVYSVDPGWVSDQFPDDGRIKRDLPLTFDDAAARLTHPIFTWKDADKPPTGIFLKDYSQTGW
ncbi:MAG: SDR family oxidoreductase [Eubacteriaceae bacterium]|nr:SDR family oxidoreductase [Eubacteriaceae bacterium]